MSKRTPDHEMTMMVRLCRDLATLQPGARRRVLAYVCARIDTLPVIAAVGGGVEEERDDDPPMLPHFRGAADAA